MSDLAAMTGSDACCTTTSRGQRRPRCLVTTIQRRTCRTVCTSRSGPGTDSLVARRPAMDEVCSYGALLATNFGYRYAGLHLLSAPAVNLDSFVAIRQTRSGHDCPLSLFILAMFQRGAHAVNFSRSITVFKTLCFVQGAEKPIRCQRLTAGSVDFFCPICLNP